MESDSIGARFADFLTRSGIDEADEFGELLNRFADSEMPELKSWKSVRLLRQQIASKKRTGVDTPYVSGVDEDPLTYLAAHYGDEIRTENLGPGQLSVRNCALYSALVRQVAPKKVGDVFDEMRRGPRPSPLSSRVQALAEILDTDFATTVRFLGNLRHAKLIGVQKATDVGDVPQRSTGRSGRG